MFDFSLIFLLHSRGNFRATRLNPAVKFTRLFFGGCRPYSASSVFTFEKVRRALESIETALDGPRADLA